MLISSRSRYGLRILLDIALNGDDHPVTSKDIADRRGITVKYLEKLLWQLKRNGYVTSKRGHNGGHNLARSLADITVGEIVRVMEGEKALARCVHDPKVCAITSDCLARQVWSEASSALFEKLDSMHLDTLVSQARKTELLGLTSC
ncbi:MAG: Rrf2 family transcriptional regulator [Desulfovibrionaceae bacterium]